jgi:predicted nucleotidyltransferase
MNKILETLQEYFKSRSDISFAFLFGSAARGKIRPEGDIDIAVYFSPEEGIEWEAFGKIYPGENRIALDLEKLLHKEVDLIVLNRAKAILADEVIRKGKPIIVKDKGLFLDFLCLISDEAEYARNWLESYYREKRIGSNR